MIQYAEDEKETGNMNRLYDNYSEDVDYDKIWGLIEYCIALVLNEKDFQNFKVHRKKLVQRLRRNNWGIPVPERAVQDGRREEGSVSQVKEERFFPNITVRKE